MAVAPPIHVTGEVTGMRACRAFASLLAFLRQGLGRRLHIFLTLPEG